MSSFSVLISYIDPGTGSMLFTIILGIVTVVIFAFRKLLLKLSFIIGGGKAKKNLNKYDYVIFSDGKQYWNVFKPICDEFEKREINLEYLAGDDEDPALKENYKFVHAQFIGSGNKAFSTLNLLSADVLLATTPGLDVYQWKRSKDVKYYVHITHDACSITSYRMFGIDYYDSILLPSSKLIPELRDIEKLRNLPKKEVKVVGSVYLDELKKKSETYKTEETDSKTPKTVPTVILAPSWGPSCLLNKYGENILKSLKDTGYNIIVRPHPQMKKSDPELLNKLMNAFPNTEKFKWNFDTDNFKVLSTADILISDFSGVVYDFSFIFERPFIYADSQLDLSPYDESWLSYPTWRFQLVQETGIKLEESEIPVLKSVIDKALSESDVSKNLNAIREVAWEHRGKATELTVNYLIDKHADLNKEEEIINKAS